MKKIVVALGGNAILTDDPSAKGQISALEKTSKYLVELVKNGYQVVITHGNGPQVGNLLLQQEAGNSESNPALPLDTCVAMTQGSIGYWLQTSLFKALKDEGIDKQIVTFLTHVVVDEKDMAFHNPTKPIGPFYTQDQANKLEELGKGKYVEDAGRGYRKVVPSPLPVNILEANAIKTMIDQGYITISAGGGGIPVVDRNGFFEGVEAVIDKDFAASKLAQLIEADALLILTGVPYVYVNYNKPNQEKLENVTVSQLKGWIGENQFAPGSMLPKIQASIDFVENSNKEVEAVVTSMENVGNFLDKRAATIVTR